MEIEHTSVKDAIADPEGVVAKRLTDSEDLFFNAYRADRGYDLIRRTHGCDFRDPRTKNLIEVKAGVLTTSQCNEFCESLFNSGLPATLAIDMSALRGFLLLKPVATIPYFDDCVFSDKVILESSKDRMLDLRYRIWEDIKHLNLVHRGLLDKCNATMNEIDALVLKKHKLEVQVAALEEGKPII